MMLSNTITPKQQYWLEQVKAADASDGTLSEYASTHDLNLKALYGWKTKLVRLGLYQTDTPEPGSGFVPVRPEPMRTDSLPGCSITLINGTRIEFTGALDSQAIRTILTSVGRKH